MHFCRNFCRWDLHTFCHCLWLKTYFRHMVNRWYALYDITKLMSNQVLQVLDTTKIAKYPIKNFNTWLIQYMIPIPEPKPDPTRHNPIIFSNTRPDPTRSWKTLPVSPWLLLLLQLHWVHCTLHTACWDRKQCHVLRQICLEGATMHLELHAFCFCARSPVT